MAQWSATNDYKLAIKDAVVRLELGMHSEAIFHKD